MILAGLFVVKLDTSLSLNTSTLSVLDFWKTTYTLESTLSRTKSRAAQRQAGVQTHTTENHTGACQRL